MDGVEGVKGGSGRREGEGQQLDAVEATCMTG